MADEGSVLDPGSWHGVAASHVGFAHINAKEGMWDEGMKALTFKVSAAKPLQAVSQWPRSYRATPLEPTPLSRQRRDNPGSRTRPVGLDQRWSRQPPWRRGRRSAIC